MGSALTAAGGDLDALFSPSSIALLGATDKSPWSVNTFVNIKDSGFAGALYLVNPKAEYVHGEKAYPDLASVPQRVDLVYVMVPTAAVLPALQSAVAHGARAAVILTAGFAEVGEEGKRLEDEIVTFARASGLTVLGPNGNGYINATKGISPYGLPIDRPLITGSVGVVLHSGALAMSILEFARLRNVGISFLTAMGNESMISVTDVMDYLLHDDGTSVIALFLESVRDPEEFARIARAALFAGKPIVALKVGRSQLGAEAARAHTGAIVGDDAAFSAAFAQLGVIRVSSVEDLIITAGLLAHSGPLPGPRLGVVTFSGGAAEIIADRAEDEGLLLPALHHDTVATLREILPPFATAQNPLDVTGYAIIDRTLMRRALEIVARDPAIDVAVLLTTLPRQAPVGPDLDTLLGAFSQSAQAYAATPVPTILMSTALTDVTDFGRTLHSVAGFPPILGGIEHGLPAIARAITWSQAHRSAQTETALDRSESTITLSPEPTGTWAEHQAGQFLAAQDIPMVPAQIADTEDEAIAAADAFGYPVVLKAVAEGLGHKSDIGGVRLNLRNAADVGAAHRAVMAALSASSAAGARTLVQPQRGADGIELLVGIVRDPTWGPVLAVGLGGIWVEVLHDTALVVLPVDHRQVRAALESLRAAPVLAGARGTTVADLDVVTDVITRIADVAYQLGDRLQALEINPLMVHGDRVEALDALITWTD